MHYTRILLLVLIAGFGSGCSIFGGDEDQAYKLSETELYDLAMESIQDGRYSTAIGHLENLESYYPFGRYSEQAQLELIYAYIKSGEEEKAVAAADRFIRLHPNHDNIDYVYYLRGISNFQVDQAFYSRFLPTDSSRRDPGRAKDSFNDFSTLITRYPNSRYAPDAQKRMLYLRNQLASYEIHVANYYVERGAYVAAANRGRYVVENFPQSPSVPKALNIMVAMYTELGLTDAASHAQQVLDSNYPDWVDDGTESAGTQDTDTEDGSLFDTVTFGVFE